jgi:TonB-dependent receptor
MKVSKSMLSASIATALLFAAAAQAQSASPQDQATTNDAQPAPAAQAQATGQTQAAAANGQSEPQTLGTIEVVGFRASLMKSLQTKRAADATVDAVTADDIGKFPNTNVAEAMTLIPGVTIDRRFGQGERVSINGTDPSLNLSFLDGHPLAQVDWLYGATPDRGFDYTILAPGIVGNIEVYKTAEARLPSGSLGGTVFIHSRQPLDMPSNTLSATVGGVYNEQASKTKPSASIFYNWKNASDTFGVNVGVSHYEESIDREGSEIFGYSPLSAFASNPNVAAAFANGLAKPSDLMPQEVNAAYFQQTRKRNSVLVNMQYKPNDQFQVGLSGMYIAEKFDNFNQSMYGFASQTAATNLTSVTTNGAGLVIAGHMCGEGESYTVGGTTTSCAATNTYIDNQVRLSKLITKDFNVNASYGDSNWGVSGRAGISKAHNNSAQYFIEPGYHGGYTFGLNTGDVFDDTAAAKNPANWGSFGGWMGNEGFFPFQAKTTYANLDFHVNFNSFINKLLFGARYVNDKHDAMLNIYGGVNPAQLDQIGDISYTDIMDSNAFPGFSADQRQHVQTSADAILNWIRNSPMGTSAPDPASFVDNTWNFTQKTEEAYTQLNFGGEALRGNVGVRFAKNKIESQSYNPGGNAPVYPPPAAWWQTASHTYNDVLPSFNLVYDNGSSVVYRFAGAKVIAWAPYTQMLGNAFLNDSVLTGSGGNPDLKPYSSYNYSGSVEWYFAPQSVLAFTAFYDHILNYISTSTVVEREFNSMFDNDPTTYKNQYQGKLGNCDANGFCDYAMTRPNSIGAGAIKGFSVSYQQPFGATGFGLVANYTYARGTTHAGFDLPYNSKNSVTVSPYYENGHFSARLDYNWRSRYLAGGYVAGAAPATVADYTDVDATVGWAFNKQWSVSLSAMNLTNQAYKMYQAATLSTPQLPLNKYTNGRRYMATLSFKL